MLLDKILEYQKIDREILQLENELANSKDRQSAAEIQQTLKSQHSRLVALEASAEKINANYTAAKKKYAEYEEKLAKLQREINSASVDPAKADLYEKAYRDFNSIANSLEKEISALYSEVQNVSKEYEEIIRRSKTSREKFDKFKAAYDKQKAEIEPKIAALKTQKQAAEKGIEAELLKMYKHKHESHIFPVFVGLTGSKCGGCRMQVSASKLSEMSKNKYGVIECENCARFIYNEG